MIEMYGIPNCNSIKKAKDWLESHQVDYTFHNYKKEGVSSDNLTSWCQQVGWETLLNKRGTTWRKLEESDKSDVDESKAIALMLANPSMIKRPVIVSQNEIIVGFDEKVYATLA